MNILLTDDDREILESLRRCLSARGHQVRTASSGQEALVRMEESPPDLVISDIQMPRMDGLAFLKAAQERFPEVPVVLMTGNRQGGAEAAALCGGARGYLEKPIRVERLLACIAEIEASGHTQP